jgi:hypothetical protein
MGMIVGGMQSEWSPTPVNDFNGIFPLCHSRAVTQYWIPPIIIHTKKLIRGNYAL